MTAARVDLFVEQGSTFTKSLLRKGPSGVPISNVGYTAKLQIRSDYGAPVILELTDISGSTGITLGGATGTIDIRIGADDTALFDVDAPDTKVGIYDLKLVEATDPSHVIRVIKGTIFVSPQVTE